MLVECGTHAIFAAHLGPYRSAEWDICQPMLASLQPGMLCLADRGFNGYSHWQAAQATGADLLWRCAHNRRLPVVSALPDGSYLSMIYPDDKSRRQGVGGISMRVIEYSLPKLSGEATRYRLMTTLLSADAAPAAELAACYHARWQIEAVFDELNTHLQQGRRTLRSKTPELVKQEFYGWVLAHYAVRWRCTR
ncbi:IS4 family transposase [Chitinimonas arctica]|uniref:IS4 family transposase n=1 Tax=Chitinimonas arctica TaxID=2594795 RepID=A0A516SAJ6_9NEIS|nr:IS4 family transposase [Chitinimonas arctica]